ncbi:hypothetical protein AGMMS50249_3430 [candidate division SR1 bacterium]|nr:hypothetical protein AGMMS50249_3430 [candidate division SR1 bacterium]
MPRLQGAQAMARDTARQTALTTIGTAIAAYQLQKGTYPRTGTDTEIREYWTQLATNKTQNAAVLGTNEIEKTLKDAGIITEVPKDRNLSNFVQGLGEDYDVSILNGNFAYAVMKKNSKINGGFMLMAATEMPGSSNRVVVEDADDLSGGLIIPATQDLSNMVTCTSLTLDASMDADADRIEGDGVCKYQNSSELRYIYMY